MKYSGVYSSLSPSNNIPVPGAGITIISVQMAPSGIANQFQQDGLQIAQSRATHIISSGVSVSGARVQRSHLKIMSLLTSNTPGGITTYIAPSSMATPMLLMPKSHHSMFT